jgi:hypothetical protein
MAIETALNLSSTAQLTYFSKMVLFSSGDTERF